MTLFSLGHKLPPAVPWQGSPGPLLASCPQAACVSGWLCPWSQSALPSWLPCSGGSTRTPGPPRLSEVCSGWNQGGRSLAARSQLSIPCWTWVGFSLWPLFCEVWGQVLGGLVQTSWPGPLLSLSTGASPPVTAGRRACSPRHFSWTPLPPGRTGDPSRPFQPLLLCLASGSQTHSHPFSLRASFSFSGGRGVEGGSEFYRIFFTSPMVFCSQADWFVSLSCECARAVTLGSHRASGVNPDVLTADHISNRGSHNVAPNGSPLRLWQLSGAREHQLGCAWQPVLTPGCQGFSAWERRGRLGCLSSMEMTARTAGAGAGVASLCTGKGPWAVSGDIVGAGVGVRAWGAALGWTTPACGRG